MEIAIIIRGPCYALTVFKLCVRWPKHLPKTRVLLAGGGGLPQGLPGGWWTVGNMGGGLLRAPRGQREQQSQG